MYVIQKDSTILSVHLVDMKKMQIPPNVNYIQMHETHLLYIMH